MAYRGFSPSVPAKPMNQVVLLPSIPVSAVPVLPPIRKPETCAAVPRSRLNRPNHHVPDVPGGRRRHRATDLRRSRPRAGLPIRSHSLFDDEWPHKDAVVADRARDHRHLQRGDEQALLPEGHPSRVDIPVAAGIVELAVLVEPARQPLALGCLEGRSLVEAERLGLLDDRSRSELEADVAEDRVDGVLQRGCERDVAERAARVEVVHALAVHRAVPGVVEGRCRRELARVERRRGGDDLERRARRIEALARAVQERRRRRAVGADLLDAPEVLLHVIRVVARR